MIEIISIILLCIILIGLKIVLGVNLKKIKELSQKSPLDELIKRLPNIEEIGKQMLHMLKNSDVKIEKSVDEKSGTSLYLVMGNKIIIANGNGSYAGVQTIAHECIHSVQNKKMLWFNFFFSNFYIIYTLIVMILTILKIIKDTSLQLYILSILGFVFYAIRSYLETEAMIKSRFLAKDYLEQKKLHNKDEIKKLLCAYDEINKVGIPTINYTLAVNVILKLLFYSVIALIF